MRILEEKQITFVAPVNRGDKPQIAQISQMAEAWGSGGGGTRCGEGASGRGRVPADEEAKCKVRLA